MSTAGINDAWVFLSFGATVVAAVVVLWLFFDVRSYVKRRVQMKAGLILPKLLGFETPGAVTVYLKDGKTHTGLRLAGVLDGAAARDAGLPHPLTQMVCFERENGARIWIDASAIRVMETAPGESL